MHNDNSNNLLPLAQWFLSEVQSYKFVKSCTNYLIGISTLFYRTETIKMCVFITFEELLLFQNTEADRWQNLYNFVIFVGFLIVLALYLLSSKSYRRHIFFLFFRGWQAMYQLCIGGDEICYPLPFQNPGFVQKFGKSYLYLLLNAFRCPRISSENFWCFSRVTENTTV